MTEAEMREATVPWPKTAEELAAYIDGLVSKEHDYGTCVYAMSMAATAAFYYIATRLGVTGFQASCADIDILRRTRHYKGPFMVLDGADALYPQYDLRARVEEFLTSPSMRQWLADEAKKRLNDPADQHAHPDVLQHWQTLATSQAQG